jgi:hypothetical protein
MAMCNAQRAGETLQVSSTRSGSCLGWGFRSRLHGGQRHGRHRAA